ncbi:MAG: Rpn family recombination-promoting nuclease/putative transposase [Prevotellaceae bacterium]|jgi:hypothetical protein|nr:Rpn family recombination-promoting nuclease/putative transposase [Prevotellaceae bacterium]
MVAIVNFTVFNDEKSKDTVIDLIQLVDVKTEQCFSDKLNFVTVDLTKFDKKESELKTLQDCWLYTLKHAETLKERPEEIKDELFINLYDSILLTKQLTQEEIETYNKSVMKLKKLSLFTDYARMEGKMEGIEIGRKEGMEIALAQVAINAAGAGMSAENISNVTGLSVEQIYKILSNKE